MRTPSQVNHDNKTECKNTHIHHNQGKQHTSSDLTCHICGKEDHLPTTGPGG